MRLKALCMKFFSGFCFQNEQEIFSDLFQEGDFVVAGFSYGAIKAFEYASTSRDRIDKLQLFSPAFFQDKSEKFKRLQTISFAKNPDKYIQNFLKRVKYPSNKDTTKYFQNGVSEELKKLLYYEWNEEKIQTLKDNGVEIEVYLGEKDKIINPNSALEFFESFADIYYIKDAGHLIIYPSI